MTVPAAPPETAELLVRAVSLYFPILLTIALALHVRPDRRRVAGALLATAWNLPVLLAVNLVAVRAGWWRFDAATATVAGIPVDLWVGWALLWGAVPVLATTRRLVLAGVLLVAADLVLMPLGEPVVVLQRSWLVGEAAAVAAGLAPGLLLGRWTARNRHVGRRAGLQVVGFTGLVLFVLPALVLTVTGEGWAPLLDRPRWQLVLAAVAVAPAGAMAIEAVRAFAAAGGTPVPLDPPASLVTAGPYAFVANPMQLAATILLAVWGLLLSSPAVVAAAAMAAVFSAGLAALCEETELAGRFGGDWRAYRRSVRAWLPRWRPAVTAPAVVYVAGTCQPCAEVGTFLARRRGVGLEVLPAETCPFPLERITYRRGTEEATGIAAVGRSLEHVNLAWAVGSWTARLPGVQQLLQLIADGIGYGPVAVDRAAAAPSEGGGTAPGCST